MSRSDRHVVIGPNETAFVIPLEGDSTAQGRVQSIDALEKAKVMAKRIYLPVRKRDLGRGPANYEWVPTLKVVKVDRSPVTREWTAEVSTGTLAGSRRGDRMRAGQGTNHEPHPRQAESEAQEAASPE